MKNLHLHCWILMFYVIINNTSSQYITYQQKSTKSNGCENASSNTALVEHFFNLIFSEYLNHPPVCVCVQMCPDQPTYCYPNGCQRKAPEKKTDNRLFQVVPHVHSIKDQSQMTFLVDPQKDFLENFLDTKAVNDKFEKTMESQNKLVKNDQFQDLRPDPFKDRYKKIFKYRKSPKVHLRYNLREQVKNMKSDVIKIEKIDVSKTKWPTVEKKQFFLEAPVSEKSSPSFPSLGISVDHPQYPNRFFKRDTANNNMKILEEADILPDKTFSLENLIENLIESSFGPLQNDTELDLNVNVDYYDGNGTTVNEPFTAPPKRNLSPNMIIINETTDVVSINNTNENIDNNKYTGVETDDNAYKNVYNEMIIKLSKSIERQNNHSMELMEQVLGHRFIDTTSSIETTDSKIDPDIDNFTSMTTNTTNDVTQIATETIFTTMTEILPKMVQKHVDSNTMNNTSNIKNDNKYENYVNNKLRNQTIDDQRLTNVTLKNSDNNNRYIINKNNNFQRKSRQRFARRFQNSKKQSTVA